MTLYRLTFKDAFGAAFQLDTIDPGKIGPWLAEMYGLSPYMVAAPPRVEIVTTQIATS